MRIYILCFEEFCRCNLCFALCILFVFIHHGVRCCRFVTKIIGDACILVFLEIKRSENRKGIMFACVVHVFFCVDDGKKRGETTTNTEILE